MCEQARIKQKVQEESMINLLMDAWKYLICFFTYTYQMVSSHHIRNRLLALDSWPLCLG